MLDLKKIYEDWLRKGNDLHQKKRYQGKEEWFHASASGMCMRKHYFQHVADVEPKKIDDDTMRLFRLGDLVHEDIQNAINHSSEMRNDDYVISMEDRIEIPEYNVVGHVDIAIHDKKENSLKVMDIKTCASYKWKMKFGRKPDRKGNPGYNMQLATYTEAFKRKINPTGNISMSLLWYNKDTSALREEPIDNSWIYEAKAFWEELNDYVDGTDEGTVSDYEKLEPGSYGIPMENWECRYCGFKDIYCKGV